MLDQRLLDILACPACKGAVVLVSRDSGESELECPQCRLAYPVRGGIPVMLVTEARPTGA